jgi:hypothetical protein
MMENKKPKMPPQNGKLGKKQLILKICRKYDIPMIHRAKGTKEETVVTEENMGEFFNLDFLLTNVKALEILLDGKLDDE